MRTTFQSNTQIFGEEERRELDFWGKNGGASLQMFVKRSKTIENVRKRLKIFENF
jgi:hypothetical protein